MNPLLAIETKPANGAVLSTPDHAIPDETVSFAVFFDAENPAQIENGLSASIEIAVPSDPIQTTESVEILGSVDDAPEETALLGVPADELPKQVLASNGSVLETTRASTLPPADTTLPRTVRLARADIDQSRAQIVADQTVGEDQTKLRPIPSTTAQNVVENRISGTADDLQKQVELRERNATPAAAPQEPVKKSVAGAVTAPPQAPLAEQKLLISKSDDREDPRKRDPRNFDVSQLATTRVSSSAAKQDPYFAHPSTQAPAGLAPLPKELSSDAGALGAMDGEIIHGLAPTERLSNGPVQTGGAVPMPPEVARQVANQMASAVVQNNGKTTEISLNPAELGRVRLSLTAVDGSLTLVVLADRPETQDLLRRHIDVLAQEFRALGYDTLSFSFGSNDQPKDDHLSKPAHEERDAAASDQEVKVARHYVDASLGVDLRL
jgi:flagellar hook-length control protein FliK